jgi:hypothetical protein
MYITLFVLCTLCVSWICQIINYYLSYRTYCYPSEFGVIDYGYNPNLPFRYSLQYFFQNNYSFKEQFVLTLFKVMFYVSFWNLINIHIYARVKWLWNHKLYIEIKETKLKSLKREHHKAINDL